MTVTSWEEAADVGGLHADGGQAWTALRAWLRHEGPGGQQGGAEAKGVLRWPALLSRQA